MINYMQCEDARTKTEIKNVSFRDLQSINYIKHVFCVCESIENDRENRLLNAID